MKNKEEFQSEQVIYECKPHWIRLLFPIITGGLFGIAGIIELFSGIFKLSKISIENSVIYIILALLIFGIPFLIERTNKLVLTDKRLYGRSGIFRAQKLSIPVQKVQYVNIDSGLFGRLLGYSDIKINAITGMYLFKKQKNAEEMQNAILNTIK